MRVSYARRFKNIVIRVIRAVIVYACIVIIILSFVLVHLYRLLNLRKNNSVFLFELGPLERHMNSWCKFLAFSLLWNFSFLLINFYISDKSMDILWCVFIRIFYQRKKGERILQITGFWTFVWNLSSKMYFQCLCNWKIYFWLDKNVYLYVFNALKSIWHEC